MSSLEDCAVKSEKKKVNYNHTNITLSSFNHVFKNENVQKTYSYLKDLRPGFSLLLMAPHCQFSSMHSVLSDSEKISKILSGFHHQPEKDVHNIAAIYFHFILK